MILPQWMRQDVDNQGRETLQELRLRINAPPELVCAEGCRWLNRTVSREDLSCVVNAASRYSPWASETMKSGFLTAFGGHRIGICGAVSYFGDGSVSIGQIRSLCIRVARDFPGMSRGTPETGSILILGAPGWGKTTLLRDIARSRSQHQAVCVVDEREELFPEGFSAGKRMDVLSGCRKLQGISQVLRTMSPQLIAVDEITEEADCIALIKAVGCGVELLATAHASCMEDFRCRRVYRPLLEHSVFQHILVLDRNRHWHREGGRL